MTVQDAMTAWPRLTHIHPRLVEKLVRVLNAMDALGHPMRPVSFARTAAEQHELWRQGREKPGKIVTKADGFTSRSNHQIQSDGYGHAVDCAFVSLTSPLQIDWSDARPWATYGACVRAVGAKWGGDWKTFTDRPHMELA